MLNKHLANPSHFAKFNSTESRKVTRFKGHKGIKEGIVNRRHTSKGRMDHQGNANGGQVEVADLARQMNEMMVQFNALATYVQNQGTQQERVVQEETTTHEPEQEQEQGGKPTKHLGPLATYDGEKAQLEPWISQVEAKITVDYSSCAEITRFYMVHNHLRGDASKQLQPWIRTVSGTNAMTVQNLIQQLRSSFGDPHVKAKAQRKLHKLEQKNRPFTEHFTEFRKLMLEAGGANWPDDVKRSFLEPSLSLDLHQCMLGFGRDGIDKSFDEYCTELKFASDKVEAFNLRKRGLMNWRDNHNTSTGTGTTKQTNSRHQDSMDWEPTRAIHVQKNETKAVANQDTASNGNKRRATWVGRDALDYRMEKRLCLRCGNAGHIVRSCSFLPPHRPMTSNVSTASKEMEPVDSGRAQADAQGDEQAGKE